MHTLTEREGVVTGISPDDRRAAGIQEAPRTPAGQPQHPPEGGTFKPR